MFATGHRGKGLLLGLLVGLSNLTPMVAGQALAADGFQPSWKLAVQAGGSAKSGFQKGKETSVRIDIDKPGNETWAISLVFPCPSIEKGKTYRVKARLRADRPRVATLAASQDGPPFAAVGLFRQLELTTQWKDYSVDFQANSSQSPARMYIDLGGHLGNVELASFVLENDGQQTTLFPSQPAEAPKPDAVPAPTAPSASPIVAKTDSWEFSTDGIPARCRVLSVQPWGIGVQLIDGNVDPAKAIVKRRMTLDGSKPTMEVRTKGPAELRYRISQGNEVRQAMLTIPAAGNHRVELDLGGLPPRGAIEFQFQLGGKNLDWELWD